MTGKLIICSAPSGSGKTTLVKHLLNQNLGLNFSISATSRPPRKNEIDGKDYHFLSPDTFKEYIVQDAFVEWEQVYKNTFYGTLKKEVEHKLDQGQHIIFDVDVVGGTHLKEYYGKNALAIYIAAPSLDELEVRLRNRLSDSDEVITERLAKAKYESSFQSQFDITIVNDDLKTAKKEILDKVKQFLEATENV